MSPSATLTRQRALLDAVLDRLSPTERDQLGRYKPLQRGGVSEFRYVPRAWWPAVRAHMVARSRASAERGMPGVELPERMTAYTPGETLHLLAEPEVVAWHRSLRSLRLPECDARGRPIELVALVPCAKTKPWDTATQGLYGAYNTVRRQVADGLLPPTTFVTVSEPLGLVPEAAWGTFPQYDNPGLFTNEVLRAGGLMTEDWASVTPTGEKCIIPFDPEAYQQAIQQLGGVIASAFARIAATRPELRLISFVENMDGSLSTHGDMLNHATATVPILAAADRHRKKAATRRPPAAHLAEVLLAAAASQRRTGRGSLTPRPPATPAPRAARKATAGAR